MAESYIPPPPYETSQQEFDRKTAQALEVSNSISAAQPPSSSQAGDDDQWEIFDEAAFEAAFQAAVKQRESQGGSSSSGVPAGHSAHLSTSLNAEKWAHPTSSSVQPLRVHKKAPSDTQPKERPNWFAEANLDEGSTFQPLPGPPGSHRTSSPRSEPPQHGVSPEQDGDGAQAPPPFHSVSDPPFVEVILAYHDNDNGSAPPSPLSPSLPRPQSRHIPSPSSSPQPGFRMPSRSPRPQPHQSLPPPARRVPHRMSPRPVTTFTPASGAVSQPHMNFDHSVAYARRHDVASPSTEPLAINAAAFYNSAVSAHLSSAPSKPGFQPYIRQSQYHSHQLTAPPNTSPTYSAPAFLPYVLRPDGASLAQPIPNGTHAHHHPPHLTDAQARWATSEEQIRRDF